MRLEQLTFTRFLAAISIVVFHYGKDIFPFNHVTVDFLFRQANIGVSYFFILSGFVMIIAYGNKEKIEFGDYIKKRFARIYPVYFLAILILLASLVLRHKPIDYEGLILNIILIQTYIPGYALSFNSPGWSLSVEMFFYATFPFIFNFFYKKYPLNKVVIPIFVFFTISQIAFHALRYSSFYDGAGTESHEFLYYFPLMHLSEFLIGNIAGIYFLQGVKERNYDLHIIGLTILLSILLKFNIGINYHNGMLAFIFIPLIILISANNGVLTKISNNKVLVFLGEISYSIYILQVPIFIWAGGIIQYLNIQNPVVVFYLSLIILIVFSGLSYTYFETPLRKIINKKRVKLSLSSVKESV